MPSAALYVEISRENHGPLVSAGWWLDAQQSAHGGVPLRVHHRAQVVPTDGVAQSPDDGTALQVGGFGGIVTVHAGGTARGHSGRKPLGG